MNGRFRNASPNVAQPHGPGAAGGRLRGRHAIMTKNAVPTTDGSSQLTTGSGTGKFGHGAP
jgi:hypothetical protein